MNKIFLLIALFYFTNAVQAQQINPCGGSVQQKEFSGEWTNVTKAIDEFVKFWPATVKNLKSSKENMVIKVIGNSAWVQCDNIMEFDNGSHFKWKNFQICFLQKMGSVWKISYHAIIDNPKPGL